MARNGATIIIVNLRLSLVSSIRQIWYNVLLHILLSLFNFDIPVSAPTVLYGMAGLSTTRLRRRLLL